MIGQARAKWWHHERLDTVHFEWKIKWSLHSGCAVRIGVLWLKVWISSTGTFGKCLSLLKSWSWLHPTWSWGDGWLHSRETTPHRDPGWAHITNGFLIIFHQPILCLSLTQTATDTADLRWTPPEPAQSITPQITAESYLADSCEHLVFTQPPPSTHARRTHTHTHTLSLPNFTAGAHISTTPLRFRVLAAVQMVTADWCPSWMCGHNR